MKEDKLFNIKNVTIIAGLAMLFSFFGMCSGPSADDVIKARKEIVVLQNEIDSLRTSVYSKDELNIRMEIQGLKTSKRTLYDWNSVIRTTVRPDDAMNAYDSQIEALEKELN